ncbi:hypothetical protein AVEN_52705-1 [Araneus ventricosus]|uniref:F-box domain-containing protein n=1 Tax=Araneus ventricosus TaxID=182803 RepID=A0A4Y2EM07_ARAVE|nr:hypothetical protein AVEN_52705-1 [Araneus ventricosus]
MDCFPRKIDPTLRFLLDNRSAKSIASRETDEHEKEGKWCNLPFPALEKIYSFARRGDQFNMSLVCRKWSEGFRSPSVCNTFRFALTKSQLSTDNCPVMKFVQKYGSMFRHVEIKYTFLRKKYLIKTWCRHFIVFLQLLANTSQIISIEFQDLTYCFQDLGTPTYNDICIAIADFLISQHLKRVEFYDCSFSFREAVELLRKLTENSRESLTHLVLRKFVLSESYLIKNSTSVKNPPTFECLPRLKTLEIDCSFLFENMVASQSTTIQTVKNCQTLALSKIILHHHSDPFKETYFRGLTSTDWQFMKMLCPDLQVELIISTCSPFKEEVELFIVPNMPITRLKYTRLDWKPYIKGMVVEILFRRLLACKINDHLVSLSLESEPPILDLASFIPFLQACKKLKCLELFVIYATSGIDHLLESWLDNRPESLKEVLIKISDIEDEEDYTNVMNITTDCVSRLESAGLKVEVNL